MDYIARDMPATIQVGAGFSRSGLVPAAGRDLLAAPLDVAGKSQARNCGWTPYSSLLIQSLLEMQFFVEILRFLRRNFPSKPGVLLK